MGGDSEELHVQCTSVFINEVFFRIDGLVLVYMDYGIFKDISFLWF